MKERLSLIFSLLALGLASFSLYRNSANNNGRFQWGTGSVAGFAMDTRTGEMCAPSVIFKGEWKDLPVCKDIK